MNEKSVRDWMKVICSVYRAEYEVQKEWDENHKEDFSIKAFIRAMAERLVRLANPCCVGGNDAAVDERRF